MGLFADFPSAMIVVGDAERLEREVAALERALEYDRVRVRMVWAKDAVRDICRARRVRVSARALAPAWSRLRARVCARGRVPFHLQILAASPINLAQHLALRTPTS